MPTSIDSTLATKIASCLFLTILSVCFVHLIMRFEIAFITAATGLVVGQTLNIPTRSGSIVSLASPSVISGSKDMGNKEYDRGRACDTDADTGSDSAVFILENGATLSNVIIGANQLEGVHCKGACTLKNVWFRDVCEGECIVPARALTLLTHDRCYLGARKRGRAH